MCGKVDSSHLVTGARQERERAQVLPRLRRKLGAVQEEHVARPGLGSQGRAPEVAEEAHGVAVDVDGSSLRGKQVGEGVGERQGGGGELYTKDIEYRVGKVLGALGPLRC